MNRLGDKQPIKRITMMEGELGYECALFGLNGQFPESAGWYAL